MIKRFNITVLDGQCLAAMSAHSEGSYVRYADIAHLLEEKTLEQHREEFEEWLLLCQTFFDPDKTAKILQDAAWEAWKAAKGIKE